jgi:hypothetical protein
VNILLPAAYVVERVEWFAGDVGRRQPRRLARVPRGTRPSMLAIKVACSAALQGLREAARKELFDIIDSVEVLEHCVRN